MGKSACRTNNRESLVEREILMKIWLCEGIALPVEIKRGGGADYILKSDLYRES